MSSPQPWFRFSLRTLFTVAFVLAIVIGVASRGLNSRVKFEIRDTQLKESDGFLNGIISYRCSQLDSFDHREVSDTHLHVKNISGSRLAQLHVGDEFFVSYRERGFWPLAKENHYLIFMTRDLGLYEDEIEGFVHMDGWTEVYVKGAINDLGRK